MAKAPKRPGPGHNDPLRAKHFEFLGQYTEVRFQQMRWASKAAHVLAAFEAVGGDRKDIQDGFLLGKMTEDERLAERDRINRVWVRHGLAEEDNGQWSFSKVLDAKETKGAGGNPLGTLASVALARVDGYNSAKAGGALADCPWPIDTKEAEAWADGFGKGLEDRPPPKPSKAKDPAEGNGTGEDKPKRRRKSSLEALTERAAGMPTPADTPTVIDPEQGTGSIH